MRHADTYVFEINHEKPVTKTEILKEIRNVLLSEPNKDDDCISLYDVAQLIKRKREYYENIIESYERRLTSISKRNGLGYTNIVVDNDFKDENKIKIDFNTKYNNKLDNALFFKEDDDLYIIRPLIYDSQGKQILLILGNTISQLYDVVLQYNRIFDYYVRDIKSMNSDVSVDIIGDFIDISFAHDSEEKFKLELNNRSEQYEWRTNSYIIASTISESEHAIFKKVFVKIEDCPEWSRDDLYKIRKNQLEGKNTYLEETQPEKTGIKRKILSFLKR